MANPVMSLSDQSVACSLLTAHFQLNSPHLEPWLSRYFINKLNKKKKKEYYQLMETPKKRVVHTDQWLFLVTGWNWSQRGIELFTELLWLL